METGYALAGEVHIAYRVEGRGPADLLLLPDGMVPIEATDEEPSLARFLDRLAAFSRLIRFDRRGMGLSDPFPAATAASLDAWMEDARAVLGAVGSEKTALLGIAEGGFVATLLAATHPSAVSALVLLNASPAIFAPPFDRCGQAARWIRGLEASIGSGWGMDFRCLDGDIAIACFAPSVAGDSRYRDWFGRALRRGANPAMARAVWETLFGSDLRSILPAVRVPTLVIHRAGNRWLTPEHGRYLAENIPGARYVEVPGDDHVPYLGDPDPILGEIEEFVTGTRQAPESDRMLATVLFCDIASSTERVATLGDRRWQRLLDSFNRLARDQVQRWRGRDVKTLGDGFMAAFDSPARAIRCAGAIGVSVAELGLVVRSGLHTGECEVVGGGDVGGLAVHIAARVAAHARPGEVLVSRTVRDLVAGSGLDLVDRGAHVLRGVPEEWRLYAVASEQPVNRATQAVITEGQPARPSKTTERPGGLSSRELDVLALVAAGLSNPEIARRLFLSARTVENHVAHILVKLDLRNRAEIARWAAEHGLAQAAR